MNPRDLFLLPNALPVLLLVPLVWLLQHILDRVRAARLKRVTGGARVRALTAEMCAGQRRARRRLAAASLFLALIAMLQPVLGEGVRKVEQPCIDIVVCLDVSQSMLARDLHPSRLDRAKNEIRTLAERVSGIRMALVVFAGEARLRVPLTRDMVSFAGLLEEAGPFSVERGGTDIGSALECALKALEGATGSHEVVLLLTDGEEIEQSGISAAKKCLDRNIKVHCAGFGSTRGSKITIEENGSETFLLDRFDEEVVSTMRPERMRRIAETAGGGFVNAGTGPFALLDLYKVNIAAMARKSLDADAGRVRMNRYQWPLLGAFLLLIMELCLTDRRKR